METKEKKPLTILTLKAENIKRIKAIEIDTKGESVTLTGKNGQGKTSVIDAIWLALCYKKATSDISQPLRMETVTGEIELDLGPYIVRRHWTNEETSYLEVKTPEGFKAQSPQALLDSMIGDLSFDPLDFVNLKPVDQMATLMKLVTLDINPVELAEQRKFIYDNRTIINASIKELTITIERISFPDETPDEPISSEELLKQLTENKRLLSQNNSSRAELGLLQINLENQDKNVQQQQHNIDILEKQLETARLKLKSMREEKLLLEDRYNNKLTFVRALVDPDDSIIQTKLETMNIVNNNVDAKNTKNKLQNQLANQRQTLYNYELQIKEIDDKKQSALSRANFPLPGLGFGDNEVTYLGIPFAQLSTAERLKVSISIAMALNPTLRVILIREASMFDTDNLALIKQLAKDKGYQLWIEKVAEKADGISVFIEDGNIQGKEGAKPFGDRIEAGKGAKRKAKAVEGGVQAEIAETPPKDKIAESDGAYE